MALANECLEVGLQPDFLILQYISFLLFFNQLSWITSQTPQWQPLSAKWIRMLSFHRDIKMARQNEKVQHFAHRGRTHRQIGATSHINAMICLYILYRSPMDEGTLQAPIPKCRLY